MSDTGQFDDEAARDLKARREAELLATFYLETDGGPAALRYLMAAFNPSRPRFGPSCAKDAAARGMDQRDYAFWREGQCEVVRNLFEAFDLARGRRWRAAFLDVL